MFRQIATKIPVTTLFDLHPAEIAAILERVWQQRFVDTNERLGHPKNRSLVNELPPFLPVPQSSSDPFPLCTDGSRRKLRWDHLIYAYMIENTRVFEIFRRVISELVHGEKL